MPRLAENLVYMPNLMFISRVQTRIRFDFTHKYTRMRFDFTLQTTSTNNHSINPNSENKNYDDPWKSKVYRLPFPVYTPGTFPAYTPGKHFPSTPPVYTPIYYVSSLHVPSTHPVSISRLHSNVLRFPTIPVHTPRNHFPSLHLFTLQSTTFPA